jgi:uncharacterized protein involved in copper resistance
MIVSTVLAATLAAAQPQATPPVDHSKMDHSKMDHKAAPPNADKAMAGMDCCKDGCACCAKEKAKPAA